MNVVTRRVSTGLAGLILMATVGGAADAHVAFVGHGGPGMAHVAHMGHPGMGHPGHDGHGHFHGGRFFLGLGDYDYGYGYGYGYGGCSYYRHRARVTGSPYWWRRYRECLYD